MRTTITGLTAVAVLALAGSLAHAQQPFVPPGQPWACNSPFYNVGQCGCWYGPNYCFQGPCLPAAPFNGMLAIPNRNGAGGAGAGFPGIASFPTHPFARSPRDFFMYGQQYND
jgi:hypothetical protein